MSYRYDEGDMMLDGQEPIRLCPPAVVASKPLAGTKEAAKWRKQRPLTTGVLDFFPNALLEVAYCSYRATAQHHPGEPMHWDKSKSTDEADALLRHLMERGGLDTDGVRHSAKVVWRALALLERELEEEGEA